MEVVNLKFNISLFFLSLFLLVFLLVGFVSAANWYVDRDAPVGGNGQSWGTAWNNFSVINWSRVQPGDTIYISGGVTEKVYNEGIRLGKSGVRITKGVDAGHNGRAVLRAPSVGNGTAIINYDRSNITIDNLDFENWQTAIYLNGVMENIYIKNNRLLLAGGFVITGGGRDFTGPKRNIWIMYNNVTTLEYCYDQCEMSFYGTKNVYVIGNIIINRNNNPVTHDDFAQGDGGNNIYFINNFFMFASNVNKEGNANGLSAISNHGGDWFSINNVFSKTDYQINANINHFYRPNRAPNLYFRNDNVKVVIIGNDDVMWCGRHFVVDYDQNAIIKNNILWNPGRYNSISGFCGLNRFISPDLADNGTEHPNDFYVIENNLFINNFYPELNMVYLGGETPPPMHPSNIFIQNKNATPGFVNWSSNTENVQNYRLDSNSIAINKGQRIDFIPMHPDNPPEVLNYLGSGMNLATYYAKRDFNGNLRGVDGSWDIGAFEYVSGSTNFHPADLNNDGCISLSEISAFVGRWLNGDIVLNDVSGAVSLWLGGC
ncbi:MAG: hypothetical protein KatS3mg002_0141 [Candidatus Woesearchaeota archaeon]|nr:MAG: hypothetical protein KatS3mg002_0141 [Candidatus Woesearchaeota archaeon]